MESGWVDVFIDWFPILLLIGVWVLFFVLSRGPQKTYADLMKRQVEALERIAATLETKR
jgi:ATP-dependent Zn protease